MDYAKHYDTLIQRAQARSLSGYAEQHHILPKCMGGSDLASNLVYLTPEEHYVAHQLLIKIYPDNRLLVFAAHKMTSDPHGHRINLRLYGWLRRKHTETIKNHLTGRVSERKGRTYAEIFGEDKAAELKHARSLQWRAKPKSQTHRKRISDAHKGKKKTAQHIKNQADAQRGRISSRRGVSQKTVQCPHCGATGGFTVMPRWHFDRCAVIK